jgi:hypothetical protein
MLTKLNVTVIDVNDSHGCSVAMGTLLLLRELKHLDLTLVYDSQGVGVAIAAKGKPIAQTVHTLTPLASVMKQLAPLLTRLVLHDMHIVDRDRPQLLMATLPYTRQLKELSLSEDKITCDGLRPVFMRSINDINHQLSRSLTRLELQMDHLVLLSLLRGGFKLLEHLSFNASQTFTERSATAVDDRQYYMIEITSPAIHHYWSRLHDGFGKHHRHYPALQRRQHQQQQPLHQYGGIRFNFESNLSMVAFVRSILHTIRIDHEPGDGKTSAPGVVRTSTEAKPTLLSDHQLHILLTHNLKICERLLVACIQTHPNGTPPSSAYIPYIHGGSSEEVTNMSLYDLYQRYGVGSIIYLPID